MPVSNYDLIIIGGGSGGLTAARVAAALGAGVLLIDKERLGGDCLYTGCVPSKSLIHAARLVHQARTATRLGLTVGDIAIDMQRVAESIQGVIKQVSESERLYTEDVTVRFGSVSLVSPTTVMLNDEKITARALIIATGSHPARPNIEGLEDIGYLTNEDVFNLTKLPTSLLVVGGGPVGVELGQALARLGVQVTLLQGLEHILPREEPEVSEAITDVLSSEGITVVTGARVYKAERHGAKKSLTAHVGGQESTFEADEILIAAGRQPNIAGLHLEAAGVNYTECGIQVDSYLRTSVANIFAIGDVIGGHLFTHAAAYQAGVVVRNALLPLGRKKADYRAMPWCTFTDPEVAHVGLTYAEAQQSHQQVRVITFPWSDIDRAQTEHATKGFMKIILGGRKEEIVGAHLVGAHAGEVLGEIALIMQHHLGTSALRNTTHPYPTYSTGLQQAMFEAYLTSKRLRSDRTIIQTALCFRR